MNTPEGKLFEKNSNNLSVSKAAFNQYKIKIIETIVGNVDSMNFTDNSIIISANSQFQDYVPQLKPGMRIISPIAEGSGKHSGKYLYIHYGFYYVTDNDLVLSAYPESNDFKFSGKTRKALQKSLVNLYNNN